VNWGLLSLGVGQLLVRLQLPRLEMLVLIVGVGATAAILWELTEYFAFIRHSSELDTAYTDTLGDMTLGLGGATVAAVVSATLICSETSSDRDDAEPPVLGIRPT
jgi:hypothetical protein